MAKWIAFSTNLTGCNNLWKVSADGGWPIQLSQSHDGSRARLGRRMASGSSTNPIWEAVNFTIFLPSQAMAARSST